MNMFLSRASITVVFAFAASISVAAPIEYRLQMTFGHDGFEAPHPVLVGATLNLSYEFDASTLIPTMNNNGGSSVGWYTAWPTTNTSVVATISGTASRDGTFVGAMDSMTPMDWEFVSDVNSLGGKDQIRFPRIQFPFDGGSVRILDIRANFDDLLGSPTSTIYPVAFAASAPAWDASAKYATSNPAHRSALLNVSGLAVVVPEPQSICLVSTAIAALVVRRKSSRRVG